MIRDLTAQVLRHAADRNLPEGISATDVPGLSLSYHRRPGAMEHSVLNPLVCCVVSGRKEALAGDRLIVFEAGQVATITMDMPAVSRAVVASPETPYAGLGLSLDMALIRAILAELPPGELARERAEAGRDYHAAGLFDALGRLLALSGRPGASAVLAPAITREAHFRLLTGPDGARLERLAEPDGQAARIARAVARIRQSFAETLPVAVLATEAGMSATVFHQAFRAATGTTPVQFRKKLRLIEARRLIARGGVPVTQAAFAVGYESPAQFSRDYAREFGASPRADKAAAV
ncbi:helix-turn-helix domain-containing protein [Rhodobacterales bacterium HKCCE2091]|nr:helix-turn-helix domain-containing protein [Rhodobacterales bacterium HKCCE2091]